MIDAPGRRRTPEDYEVDVLAVRDFIADYIPPFAYVSATRVAMALAGNDRQWGSYRGRARRALDTLTEEGALRRVYENTDSWWSFHWYPADD